MSGDERETVEASRNGEVTAGPGPDEMFCAECGSIIKQRAEICPECGVRQRPPETASPPQGRRQSAGEAAPATSLSDRRQYELEKMASKDKTLIAVIGVLLSPLAYWMVGKKGLAVINFLTFNYFLLGVVLVPIHCYSMISDAEDELRKAGVGGY